MACVHASLSLPVSGLSCECCVFVSGCLESYVAGFVRSSSIGSVVYLVITSASHAEGREFDPLRTQSRDVPFAPRHRHTGTPEERPQHQGHAEDDRDTRARMRTTRTHTQARSRRAIHVAGVTWAARHMHGQTDVDRSCSCSRHGRGRGRHRDSDTSTGARAYQY